MRRRQEGGRLEAAEVKEAACAGELAEGRGELEEQEAEARAAAGGEELRPEQTCEQLQARINAIMKERLEQGENYYGVRALARYRELAGEIELRKKVADLKGLRSSLEEQMGRRRELFQTGTRQVGTLVHYALCTCTMSLKYVFCRH